MKKVSHSSFSIFESDGYGAIVNSKWNGIIGNVHRKVKILLIPSKLYLPT